MLCKHCNQDTYEHDKVFCNKTCQKSYNKGIELKIKERDTLPHNYRQALSYIYHTLSNPTELQIKEVSRYYFCDYEMLKKVIPLSEYCKEESLYRKEIVLSKWQVMRKRKYEQKKFKNTRDVC